MNKKTFPSVNIDLSNQSTQIVCFSLCHSITIQHQQWVIKKNVRMAVFGGGGRKCMLFEIGGCFMAGARERTAAADDIFVLVLMELVRAEECEIQIGGRSACGEMEGVNSVGPDFFI